MSFFDDFTPGVKRMTKAQRERKQKRDARIQAGLEKRLYWTREQFEDEEKRLAEEIENWPDRKAA